jgi:DNA phosphorothioation-associated DGQHR protein 1
MESEYLELPALKVRQPLGDFYVISISARHLLDVSFSEPLRYIDSSGNVQGSQRPKDNPRLKKIATYIESAEMAFPNSIILAANYAPNGAIIKEETDRWKIIEEICENTKSKLYKLIIPKKIKLAAVIDGQHRLNAFEYVNKEERFSDLQLVCSVYFDLPNSYQAFLFATINSNQKRVDRSLALEQFGYNVDDESERAWTPEKFAVFFSRKLNTDKETSPFYSHIKVTPLNSEVLFLQGIKATWFVSTATIVDGICSLISTNVVRDRILMQQKKSFLMGRSRDMLKEIRDNSPLRSLFLTYQDKTIYDTIIEYFSVVKDLFWNDVSKKSYIIKTVGIQASFDILKIILLNESSKLPTLIDFNSYLTKARDLDFTDKFFQASGIGRNRIKNAIGIAIGLVDKNKIKKADLPYYDQILSGSNTSLLKEKWYWEDEAENTIIYLLENAQWNYQNKTVSIYIDDNYETSEEYDTYAKLFNKLVEIAEDKFISNLPIDNEFANEQREKFDADDMVTSQILQYEENIRKLGWL